VLWLSIILCFNNNKDMRAVWMKILAIVSGFIVLVLSTCVLYFIHQFYEKTILHHLLIPASLLAIVCSLAVFANNMGSTPRHRRSF
jgi:hypothetical protein